jgi:HlyD family secretion protein
VNQAKSQVDASRAQVLNQQAMVEKTRADLENAKAALASARAQTAKAQVAVFDGRRNLLRQRELKQKELIAQADEDTAQATFDSAVAQHDANQAQENAQVAAVSSATAQLKVAEAQLDNARAQVSQNEAALRQAQLDLDHTIIRAPVDGVVVSRTVDVGQTVAASLQAPTLFTIAQDLTKMQVDTSMDEADVGRVVVGQRTTFTVDAFPGRTWKGEVVQIRKAPQIVQNVVTYDVVVSADNPELKLLPGMTANVRIVTEQKEDVLRVANAALRFRPVGVEADRPQGRPGGPGGSGGPGGPGGGRGGAGGGTQGRVWVVGADGKPRPIAVRLGITDGTNTEVISEQLKEQQDVIVGTGGGSDRAAPSSGPGGPRLRL